jgi:predicted anti-sigma-YlaC factor YlaD
MSERRHLQARLLGTDREDSGCDLAFAVLDEYVDAELEGRSIEARLPAVAEHLRNCEACHEDHEGLVALARERSGP